MNEFDKGEVWKLGEVWRSPSGLRYVVEKTDEDKVFLTRQLGTGRGFKIIEVLKEDMLEWRKV